jgi:tetratricopeptide (TPR) repeat protein
MPRRLSAAALLASLLAWNVSAAAEPPAAAKPTTAAELRRDPRGIKGISPFREALVRGDRALLARDIEAALVAYREAIAKQPENPLGHYRMGEAQVIKGDLKEADSSFSAGLRLLTAESPSLNAKLQFALADVRERQKAYDEASAQWSAYAAFTTVQKDAQGFPASGNERKKAVETWIKLQSDSLAVKARIDKGVQAAEEAVKKSSQ